MPCQPLCRTCDITIVVPGGGLNTASSTVYRRVSVAEARRAPPSTEELMKSAMFRRGRRWESAPVMTSAAFPRMAR